jgi:hypothetical protein
MDLASLLAELSDLESDPTTQDEVNLNARARAIDFLDFVAEVVRVRGTERALDQLRQRAAGLRDQLAELNEQIFRKVRQDLRTRLRSPEAVRRELDRFTGYATENVGQPHFGYDGLDVLLDGVLGIDRRVDVAETTHPEMIHYEPTPARVVLELVDRVALNRGDVFYDLGSGLGHVVLLVSLLTGIPAKGIEVQASLCRQAERFARELGLPHVEFIEGDARHADYSAGTVFYLFTPFKGKMLNEVLRRLEQESLDRPITVCSYGSVTRHLFGQPWLSPHDPEANHDYKLAIFQRTG